MIKYQDGILAFDLRFIKRDPTAVQKKSNWERLGAEEAQDLIDVDADTREIFMQAKRAHAVLTKFIEKLAPYTDQFFSKEDKSYMGVKLEYANTLGGGFQYKQCAKYGDILEDFKEKQEEVRELIRTATKRSRIKDPDAESWEESWFHPITGEEYIFTEEDSVAQTGRSGFKYSI